MGNCILKAISVCGKSSGKKTDGKTDQQSAGNGRFLATAASVSALASDLLHYDITNQVGDKVRKGQMACIIEATDSSATDLSPPDGEANGEIEKTDTEVHTEEAGTS